MERGAPQAAFSGAAAGSRPPAPLVPTIPTSIPPLLTSDGSINGSQSLGDLPAGGVVGVGAGVEVGPAGWGPCLSAAPGAGRPFTSLAEGPRDEPGGEAQGNRPESQPGRRLKARVSPRKALLDSPRLPPASDLRGRGGGQRGGGGWGIFRGPLVISQSQQKGAPHLGTGRNAPISPPRLLLPTPYSSFRA